MVEGRRFLRTFHNCEGPALRPLHLAIVVSFGEWHFQDMFRWTLHAIIVIALTILTQIGGLAWIVSCRFRRRFVIFVGVYATLSVMAAWVAPNFGRVALSCFDDGPLQVQSWVYCGLNRNYVSPDMASVLAGTAETMAQRYPGTVTQVLDANFPFLDGFPLLPHLSHDDGDKADIAFYYQDESGYLPGKTRSPIGYFAFEQGPTNCPDRWPTLRWNFEAVQPLLADFDLEPQRTRTVLRLLSDNSSVGKIFVEPHMVQLLAYSHAKIRFQGCRAARHDDHIHFQLR